MQNSFTLSATKSRTNQPYNVLGMAVYPKVSGADTGGQLSVFEAEYQQHEGPPLHAHNVDETFYITSGDFLFQTGDERRTLKAGDRLFIPRNMPHAFVTISKRGAYATDCFGQIVKNHCPKKGSIVWTSLNTQDNWSMGDSNIRKGFYRILFTYF